MLKRREGIFVKRKLSFFTAALCMFFSLSLCSFNVSAHLNDDFSLENEVVSDVKNINKIITGSTVEYKVDVDISEPMTYINENGKTEFCKKVEIKNSFFLTHTNEYIAGNLLKIDFKYDNNSVMIRKDGIITAPLYNDKHWKTSSSEEVYESLEQCIVSQKSDVYNRKNSQAYWKNKDEFHVDVICSPTGEIKFNISYLDKDNNLQLTCKSESYKKIKNGLQRYVLEGSKECKHDFMDFNKDKYKYITREMHIKYTNEDNDLLVDTVVKANFRYNTDTNEVQCLSASHKDKFGRVKIKMRTGNETRTYGGAYGIIKLNYVSGCTSESYEENIIIKCDSKGNIISQII